MKETLKPREWHYSIPIDGGTASGTVVARTKSDARALIKRKHKIGVKKKERLPVGTTIEKGDEVN